MPLKPAFRMKNMAKNRHDPSQLNPFINRLSSLTSFVFLGLT